MVILAFVHEVMGKGPARGDIWLFFLCAGIIGFVLSRRRVASLLVTLPVIAFLCWLRMTELRDPRVVLIFYVRRDEVTLSTVTARWHRRCYFRLRADSAGA